METESFDRVYQKQFMELLRNAVPAHLRLADELGHLLHISADSAYRRIRSETDISLTEAVLICQHFGIPLDKLMPDTSNAVTFEINRFTNTFEFIPNISGMDQGRFIPSFTFLNGLRSNKTGLEFAFGPTMTFTKTAMGFTGPDGKWYLEKDATLFPTADLGFERRLDSRGETSLSAGFLFGCGKTFKSGRMNIPVNAYVVPGKYGTRFGLSFGWNGRERYVASNTNKNSVSESFANY